MQEREIDVPDRAIAVIGMAGRFPGARSLQQFWTNLRDGVLGIAFFDEEEIAGLPRASRPARHVPAGAVLEDVDLFDAAFFNISPREAELLDPQRRLFLQCAWEAFESAGYDPFAYEGAIGVYAGASASSYLPPELDLQGQASRSFQALLANDKDYLPTHLAYKLNLRGPCVGIQTACSTSLVAVHMACMSLLDRECDMALAGGVTVRLPQKTGYSYEDDFILSPDGHCRAFDARARGVLFGNGVGVVILKRLEEAIEDGDPIRAVILGSAVNNDGSLKVGFTAPSEVGQAQVIAEALGIAGVDARTIQYIEAHGTATPLGDAIEISALKQVFGAHVKERRAIAIGALKSSVGHLESAAGVAGLIKTVLALEHRTIPGNVGFETPNPELGIESSPFYVSATTHDWNAGRTPRRAGVSSFGIGGTNAHVVLEEAPQRSVAVRAPEGRDALLPLSARSRAALEALARSYRTFLRETPVGDGERLGDILYTASVRRRHHEHRLALLGRSKEELSEALDAFLSSEPYPGALCGQVPKDEKPSVVFVFPGQGSQWVGMGRSLLEQEPVFRAAIEACDRAIQREAGFSVLAELRADEARSRLGEIDVVQPVLFAIEVGLAALWRSWGIEPAAVVGHSLGEVAAAHVAGALSLGDAAAVICRRSRLLRTQSGKGAMALVELSMAEAERALRGYEDRLSVAVSNGPRSTVLAGEPAALDEVLAALEREQVFCRRVKVDVASHSPQMDGLRAELLGALAGLSPKKASVPMPSTVTGERVRGDELGAAYWADNLRQPVRFSQVIRSLVEAGHTLFIELSPHPILLPAVEENLRESKVEGAALASLRRQADERRSLLEALGKLYVHGYPVEWKRQHPEGGRVVDVPSYPWQRERFWIEAGAQVGGAVRAARRAGKGGAEHPLLGASLSSSAHPEERMWEQGLSVEAIPYLVDHRVQEEVIFPGAGYVEMALAAGAATLGTAELVLEEVAFEQMLALSNKGERIAQVVLTEQGAGRCVFQIASRAEGATAWTRHASGAVRPWGGEAGPERTGETLEALKQRLGRRLGAAEHYQRLGARQMDYGPAFQGVLELWAGEGEVLGRVDLPEQVNDRGYMLHPALLDACLQVTVGLFPSATEAETYVPVGMRRLSLRARPPRKAWVWATSRAGEEAEGTDVLCDLRIVDDAGRLLIEIEALRARRLEAAAGRAKDALAGCLHEVAWRRVAPLPAATLSKPGAWLLFVDRSGVGAALGARLSAAGQRCVRAVAGSSYAQSEPDLYRINPAKPDDYQRLVREAFGEEGRCLGAVHLWNLDATAIEATMHQTLSADLMHGTVSAAYLAQALVRHGFRDAPRLCLVTRGAQAVVDGEPVSVAQAPLLGLSKTMALEHPELRCTGIDLGPAAGEEDAEHLMRELAAKDREDQIALRGEGRYAARLTRLEDREAQIVPVRREAAIRLRADRSYVITGGLGGLGLVLARWLVEQGAKQLALVGRRIPGPEAQQAILAMEGAGARVECVQADVSERSEVERLFARIDESMAPLGGIVHAAGVLDDRMLLEQSEASFRKVFGPKALGAWNLHALSESRSLDFFVLYSSAAALLGSPGQGNYAAANAFLDALAHERARRGLVSMSIQWGAFAEVGLAAAQDNRGKRLSSRGIASFTPAEGLEALRRLFEHPRAEVGVVRFNARQWIEFYPSAAGLPFFAEAMTEDAFHSGGEEAQHLLERLKSADPGERQALLERLVLEQAGSVLRLPPSHIDRAAPLKGLGMDSLMSLELRNRIEASLGIRLSATILFTYPSASSLAAHLLERLGVDDQVDEAEIKRQASAEATAQKRVELERSLDELSDEQLMARLADKLGTLPDDHERNR